MCRSSAREKLEKYFKIYEQIYENPFVSALEIAENTGIARDTVVRYLDEMSSVMYGPAICLNPARNHHEYAYFLEVKHPLFVFEHIKEFPSVSSATVNFGNWNMSFISEHCIDVEKVKGYEKCMFRAIKGVTVASRVTTLDWDEAMKKMRSMHCPQEKSFLNEKVSLVPWQEWEWALYHKCKHNVRAPVTDVLEELQISQRWYRRWVSSLNNAGTIQVAFYPLQVNKYLSYDFLFTSDHQKPLVDILGLLPSTSVFFSVGEYLLARLSFVNKREMHDLFDFVRTLKQKGFCTDFFHATVVKSKEWIP